MYLEVISESKLQVVDHNRSGIRSNSETTFLIYNLNRLVILYVSYACMQVWVYVNNSYIPQTDQHEPTGRMVFRLGNVTYLLDVTPSNLL